MTRITLAIFFSSLAVLPAAAQAPAPSGLTMETSLGLEGKARAGAWCPVRVTVANSGSTPKTVVVVATGTNPDYTSCAVRRTIDLPPGSKKRAWLLVPSSNLDEEEIAVSLEDENGAKLIPAPSSVPTVSTTSGWLVLAIGSRSLGLAPLKLEDRVPVVPVLLAPADVPDRWAAFAGVDAILWHAPSAGTFESPAQIRAILDWTAAGGTLVLCGIDDPNALAALSLDSALPARPRGSAELMSLKSFGEFADHPAPICTAPVLVTECSDVPQDRVLLSERGLPLLIQRPYGTGRVVLMTVDPARAPLLDWGGMDLFWRKLLGIKPDKTALVDNATKLRRARGDLLAKALRVSGITPMPFGRVFLLLCVYLAVIGPLDYYVLKRLGHLEWTWFTLPCWVMLFSVVVYLVSRRGRDEQALLHEFSVCDVAPDRVSLWTWSAVCRPTTGPVTMAPMRGPGASLPLSGGATGSGIFGRPLELREETNGTRLDGVPVAAWDWAVAKTAWSSGDRAQGGFAATQATGGEIRIQNRTGWDLTDVVCVTTDRVGTFAEWGAGKTLTLKPRGAPGVEDAEAWARRYELSSSSENPSAPDGDALASDSDTTVAILTWLRARLVPGSFSPKDDIEMSDAERDARRMEFPETALPGDCSPLCRKREETVVIVAHASAPPALMTSPGSEGKTLRTAVVRSVVEVEK